MKNRYLKMTKWVVGGFVLCALFQNGTLVNWNESNLEKVDLKVRNKHARELLGKTYRKSAARLHENNKELSRVIFNRVSRRLPKAHKRNAGLITYTILTESQRVGLDPVFVMAMIETESSFNPNAVGPVGEIGLMQLRPCTAEWIAKKMKMPWKGVRSLRNPVVNVQIGVAYVAWLREKMDRNSIQYVSAYNMGPKNVRRLVAKNVQPAHYRNRVMTHYERLYNELQKATGSVRQPAAPAAPTPAAAIQADVKTAKL